MVQVIIEIIILKQIPNALEIFGMFSGLIGVLVIILQTKEKSVGKDIEDVKENEMENVED